MFNLYFGSSSIIMYIILLLLIFFIKVFYEYVVILKDMIVMERVYIWVVNNVSWYF